MFSRFNKLLHIRKKPIQEPNNLIHQESVTGNLSSSLRSNLKKINALLGRSDDVTIREFTIGVDQSVSAAVIYIEGLIETSILNEHVLKSIMIDARIAQPNNHVSTKNVFQVAQESVMTLGDVQEAQTWDKLSLFILSGMVAVLFDGTDKALLVEARGWEHRGVEEPASQSIIRGPRDGFSESLIVNTTLLRRRIRDPNLIIKFMKFGRRTKTDVSMIYIAGIANTRLVDEVEKRLNTIDIDAILESGYVEQLIEDNWWTVFPTLQDTERPDVAAAALLEGRVVIIVDNTPFVLIAPTTFSMMLTAAEDHYFRWFIASLIRLGRYFACFIALTLPAIYIAFTGYHPELIPTQLVISIAATRIGVPFFTVVEAFLMEIALELLREAGIRLPGPIGQTIGIVGGLIIGEAAVRANIVSPIMVIIVATTAIASFVIPSYSFAASIRVLRFGLMILSAFLGLYGLILGLIFIVCHTSTIKSFGVSYLSPFAPLSFRDLQDSIIRLPWISLHERPSFLSPDDAKRLNDKRQNDLHQGGNGAS
jgi:spore germination protein